MSGSNCCFLNCIQVSHEAGKLKSTQLCLTLCDPMDGSPPGSPVPGILQARTLEWVAISFSNAWKWKVNVKTLSHIWLLAIPWTAAYQAPPSMGFSRQEYRSGVPLPFPRVKYTDFKFFLFSTGSTNTQYLKFLPWEVISSSLDGNIFNKHSPFK